MLYENWLITSTVPLFKASILIVLNVATPPSFILIRKITAVRPPGSNTMVSSLDTLDPVTAVQMESLEHQSTSEHFSHDYEVQEPDSDTERLVSW